MMGRSGERRLDTIAVAVDKDKNSQYALKWAVENLLCRGHYINLLHVKFKHPSISAAHSLHGNSGSYERNVFLPFRCFCSRKDVICEETILEDTDISKALVDYVTTHMIGTLVLGAPCRHTILRRFKTVDVPSTVMKSIPDFCNVYVIARGKISSVRLSSSSPPSLKHDPRHIQLTNQSSSLSDTSVCEIHHGTEKGQCTPRSLKDEIELRSPFDRREYAGRYKPSSMPETDISYVSSGRPSMERIFGFTDHLEQGMSPRLRNSSDFEESSCFAASFCSGKRSSDHGMYQSTEFPSSPREGPPAWTTPSAEDLEVEMRRLKQELKLTMEMYSNACKEALTAKHKAGEYNQRKIEQEKKIEEAKLTQEAALALAEREKAKCRAALEAAAAAQRIAEWETQKRMQVEMKTSTEGEKKTSGDAIQEDVRYRKYSLWEIEEATDNFSNSMKIGEGGYGPVYRGTLEHTPVAIKVLKSDAAQGRSQFQKEVEVLTMMRHPNMVLLLGACPDHGCLVYEYMANGSLEDRLFRRGNSPVLPWQLRFRIAEEIATGLLFLHHTKPEPIVHRDLKPGNILLDRNFVSKISDVGLARLVPPSVADTVTQYRMTATAGTFCYIDPEYQQTGMLGIKSDIYSLGILLLQIITAKAPMGLAHQVERAIERGHLAEILDPAVKDWPVEDALRLAKLALQCAELRRKDRPDLETVILPELERLGVHAEQSMPSLAFGGAWVHWSGDDHSLPDSQVSLDAENVLILSAKN